jgi:mRNA-degrading endonuclease toxin of MazEF toxin-antitoxin module
MALSSQTPLRGEIWFVQLPTDPPEKGRRPVVIVSHDARNRHERAETVLAVPLTTSIHKDVPTHVFLSAGETGLQSDSAARAEDLTVLRKASLVEPRSQLRRLSDKRIRELAGKVGIAMGCLPPSTISGSASQDQPRLATRLPS